MKKTGIEIIKDRVISEIAFYRLIDDKKFFVDYISGVYFYTCVGVLYGSMEGESLDYTR